MIMRKIARNILFIVTRKYFQLNISTTTTGHTHLDLTDIRFWKCQLGFFLQIFINVRIVPELFQLKLKDKKYMSWVQSINVASFCCFYPVL